MRISRRCQKYRTKNNWQLPCLCERCLPLTSPSAEQIPVGSATTVHGRRTCASFLDIEAWTPSEIKAISPLVDRSDDFFHFSEKSGFPDNSAIFHGVSSCGSMDYVDTPLASTPDADACTAYPLNSE